MWCVVSETNQDWKRIIFTHLLKYARLYYVQIGAITTRVCKQAYRSMLHLEWPFKSSFQSSREIKWFTTSGSLWPSCCFPHNSTNYDQFCQGSHQYIPAYTCHYCRMDNPHRRYLSPGLSLAKLYFVYHEHCVKECLTPASEWVYRTTFNAEYNLTFGR